MDCCIYRRATAGNWQPLKETLQREAQLDFGFSTLVDENNPCSQDYEEYGEAGARLASLLIPKRPI